MYQSESYPWLEFDAINTDGTAKTDLDSTTTALSLSVARNNLADTSLTLSDASGPTDHGAGKIHPLGGGKYQIGIATASISSYTGKIQVAGSFTGGIIRGTTEEVSAYNPATAPNSTAPLDAAGIRAAVGLASADLDTQLGTLSTLDAAGIRTAVGLASADLDTQIATLSTLDAAGVRTAIGLATANLDTQLAAISPLDAAGIRAAVGLASANLDTQIATLSTLDAAAIRTAVGLATANLDTQLAGIPAAVEAALLDEGDGSAVIAAIVAAIVANASIAQLLTRVDQTVSTAKNSKAEIRDALNGRWTDEAANTFDLTVTDTP